MSIFKDIEKKKEEIENLKNKYKKILGKELVFTILDEGKFFISRYCMGSLILSLDELSSLYDHLKLIFEDINEN
jgi:hypothetical protein